MKLGAYRWYDPSIAAAGLIGIAAVVYRLFTLRSLPNDHFMHMVWAQQLLAGDLPGRDFVDPGMPLTYAASALVQYLRPGPFSEAALTLALMAVAAAAITLLAARLSSSLVIALSAGAFVIAIRPRLYSYPKILVPAVTLLLFDRYQRAPGTRHLIAVGICVAVGTLFRHDLGVIAGLAVLSGLVLTHYGDRASLTRATLVFTATTVLALLPYGIYVASTEGLLEHVRVGAEFAKTDEHQFAFELPALLWMGGAATSWSAGDSAVLLSYVTLAAVPLGAVWLVYRGRTHSDAAIATKTAVLTTLALYAAFLLRHPITARIPDLAAPLAVSIAWFGAELIRGSFVRSVAVRLATAAAGILLTCGGVLLAGDAGDFGQRLIDADATRGPRAVYRRFLGMREQGTVWPWTGFWPQGDLPEMTQYIDQCTAPTDRVLLTWFGPEYYYFSRRPFGGGLGLLYPGRAFTRPVDQERIVDHMRRERVVLVLMNEERAPISGYPILAAYLAKEYKTAGWFTMYDDTRVSIVVRRDLTATRTYGRDRWPCAFADEPPKT